nr:hypothetical protein [Tanacetum cinerariifolium]
KCGQAGHLQKDCKKNTTTSTSGQDDKKPGASSRVFTITEDHATKTSGTITGTLFIYGHAVFVLFDTGATHSVISSAFASHVATAPTLLDHVLCISTPMQDFVRITHVYRNLPLQFDDKTHAVNALPLNMCEFDIIMGMDWLTEHHATIDCRSYRVIFGDIHAPEFIYHGSLPGKSMQIISALQARTLPFYGCEDTQESVVELLVLALSVVKLAIYRKIARRTPLRVHLVRLIRSHVHRVVFLPSLRIMLLRPQIISTLQARTLLSHGCEGFLATIHDTTSYFPSIHGQLIVSEFSDVFPDELLGIPLVREVEFNIKLIPGAEPISKTPYRMALIELKELKDQ